MKYYLFAKMNNNKPNFLVFEYSVLLDLLIIYICLKYNY